MTDDWSNGMTIEDDLTEMFRKLQRYGAVKPTISAFGNGFVRAIADFHDMDFEVAAILLIAQFPDGYVEEGAEAERMRDLARRFRKELDAQPIVIAANHTHATVRISVTDDKTLKTLQSWCNEFPVVEVKADNTWRDHFRDEKPYGKKARRRHR
jgi:hypothetical protein